MEVPHDAVHLSLVQLTLLDSLREALFDLASVSLSGSHAGRIHIGLIAVRREDLCDTSSHGAGAKNSYFHLISPF